MYDKMPHFMEIAKILQKNIHLFWSYQEETWWGGGGSEGSPLSPLRVKLKISTGVNRALSHLQAKNYLPYKHSFFSQILSIFSQASVRNYIAMAIT